MASRVGQQNEVAYTLSNPPILNSSDIDWLKTSIPGKTFNKLTLLSSVRPNQKTKEEVYASFQSSSDVFVIYKSRYSKIVGAYFQDIFVRRDQTALYNPDLGSRGISTQTAVLGVTDRTTIEQSSWNESSYSQAYQYDESLQTVVYNDRGQLHFNLDCIEPPLTPSDDQGKDFLVITDPGYSAKNLTGSPTWAKQDQVDLACVQIEFYHGEQ
ncbi:UNKNOWN [Stylonychia lemnae]|uniref:TLDc domain-containing protein n=1 Tax=Stylonychia lemnae TaxID=5949 RepID=A0A078AL47_STYLE|nr:UNKNOWN [Stylonychia lemnae]|eukprot:CDW81588.1 UNKNOWN [Stylonychia lemnae]